MIFGLHDNIIFINPILKTMCVKVQLESESQTSAKRHYTEVAQKIGNLIRNDLIVRDKKPRRSSFKINYLAQSLNSLKQSQVSEKKSQPSFNIYTKKNLNKIKKQELYQFKQKLKQNLNQSRMKKQQNIQELTNKVRWRKTTRMMNKSNVLQEQSTRRRQEVGMMKNFLERSREYLNVIKRQNELEHAFMCFQRRIRLSESPQKVNN